VIWGAVQKIRTDSGAPQLPVQWVQAFFPTGEVAEALSWPVILKKSRRWELVELYVLRKGEDTLIWRRKL